MIGRRLKLARSAAGLSLRALEDRIEKLVTAQALGKYERNEAMPGSRVLLCLSDALGVSLDYLLAPDELSLDGVDFRKKSRCSQKEMAFLEGRTLQLAEHYLLVEESLNLQSVSWDKPRDAPFPVRELADAESAAEMLRTHWRLGIDPIPKLAELLEERGVKILSVDLADVDGLTGEVRREGKASVPIIVVKKNAWAERKRFTLAHELGHMVMDIEDGFDEEKAANKFAGAFLMPREALWSEIGKNRTRLSVGELLRLKAIFGMSAQAIAFRLHDLGVIDKAAYRGLFFGFSQRGWRSPPYQESGAMPPDLEEPSRLERLCYRALAEGALGEAKIAEILGVSVRELDRRMNAQAV